MQQQKLIAGDTLNFCVDVADYLATDGWSLSYKLVPRSASATAITINASAEGTGYRVQVGQSVTAAWVAGDYVWASYVSKAGERYTVGQGQIVIAPDPTALSPGYDGRSQAEKALADAEIALSTFKTTQGRVRKYTIGQRSMEFESSTEILPIISYWRLKVANERAAQSIADGNGDPRNLLVRFTS